MIQIPEQVKDAPIVRMKNAVLRQKMTERSAGLPAQKAMKPYIDVCDEIKAEAMKKFDDF